MSDDKWTEEQGVKAIIDLQKVVGIVEPEERAKRNWGLFQDWEKESTMRAWNAVCASAKGGEAGVANVEV